MDSPAPAIVVVINSSLVKHSVAAQEELCGRGRSRQAWCAVTGDRSPTTATVVTDDHPTNAKWPLGQVMWTGIHNRPCYQATAARFVAPRLLPLGHRY